MSRYPRVIISLEKQRRIKELARSGVYIRDIAMDFGLKPRMVARVLDGTYTLPKDPGNLEVGCGALGCDEKIRVLTVRLKDAQAKNRDLTARVTALASKNDSTLVDTLEYLKRGLEKLIRERK